MQLCEILLVEYPEKVNKNPQPIHRAVLYCVISPSSPVRRRCHIILKRIVGSLSGISIARVLVKELQSLLESNKIVMKSEIGDSNQNDRNSFVLSHSLVECVTALCSSSGLISEDFHLLAVDTFLPVHHPLIAQLSPDLWIKIVKHYNFKPKDLITQWSDYFMNYVIADYNNSPVSSYIHVGISMYMYVCGCLSKKVLILQEYFLWSIINKYILVMSCRYVDG